MNYLKKWLDKIGVKEFAELNSEEKETYRQYEIVLSGRKLTDEEVKNFLITELDQAISRITETNLSLEDIAFRKCEIKFLKKVLKFLDSPKIEKEMAERQISSIVDKVITP